MYHQQIQYYLNLFFLHHLIQNNEVLQKVYDYLKKGEIKYTTYKDDYLEGIINVDENQLIFTSIPYDKDWEVYIDGNKVETIEVLNSLLAIPCSMGQHSIKMQYKRHNIVPIIISSFVLFISIIFLIVRSLKK